MVTFVERVPYQTAMRSLLRESVLDAMRDLLTERDWSKITLADVAKQAGVSRQTLYNEFGSRAGLLQAYALRLIDYLVDHVRAAVWAHVDDGGAALNEGFRNFFIDSAADPLVRSLLLGNPEQDLLRLVTLDARPLLEQATGRLTEVFVQSWVAVTEEQAETVARGLVRVALSYVSLPPEPNRDVAADWAALLGPYIDALITVSSE